MFDANKFRAKIVEHGGTLRSTALLLGIDESTLSRKMKGESDFTRNEIRLFKQAYDLAWEEVCAIFFAA